MGLKRIEDKIREKGSQEIKEIEEKTRVDIASIEEGIENEGKRVYKNIIDKRKQELELIPKRVISNAKMNRKQQIDLKKAEIVENVFAEAKKRILELDDKEKGKILKNLAEEGKKHIKDPIVYVDKNYSKIIKAESKDLGDFGVVVVNKDDSMRIDNTLSTLLSRMEPDLKSKVGNILFGG